MSVGAKIAVDWLALPKKRRIKGKFKIEALPNFKFTRFASLLNLFAQEVFQIRLRVAAD